MAGPSQAQAAGFGWIAIARLGLVQAALGSIVVLTTSTLNRVMVIELQLAASVPGLLVGLHYALQMLRPRWGHGADVSRRRTPWIIGGMALLALGGTMAAAATALMASDLWSGMALAIAGFVLIGIGVGASGTALLTLLADGVTAQRRPAAAALVWIMMICGFIITTIIASIVISPFSFARLIGLSAGVGLTALIVTSAAVIGLESGVAATERAQRPPFATALRLAWQDDVARRFAIFIFLSMLAYSAQDLILEPFAGIVFGMTPAETTALTSLQNGGVLAGMLSVALLGKRLGGDRIEGMRLIVLAGCLMSGASLVVVAWAGAAHIDSLIRPAIVALGYSNGVFAIAAIGMMMTLAGPRDGAGVRMGVWGAAQAVAFGAGGFLGTVAVDAARALLGSAIPAYASVFLVEACLFTLAAAMMARFHRSGQRDKASLPYRLEPVQ